ncbi:hypothetical protein ACFWEJ_25315 [Promicromonospora sp. NPDC060204]|uniref:hypothetical protein n=1 Tax=Promicromonospora sp. NPDC060204 TaxID=3347071 RepID=UPI003647315D
MTSYDHAQEPLDDGWLAHVREVSGGVVPPSPADAHALANVAVRRTRTRRAVLATGGGLTAVAAFAGAAFALGGPTTSGELLPGGAPSSSASVSASASGADAAAAAGAGSAEVPAGWDTDTLDGLTYALPPDVTRSGDRIEAEPGILADFWRHKGEDVPPYIHVARITPEYEFYDTKARGLTQTPGAEADEFDLPGASVATVEKGTEELREVMGASPTGTADLVRIIVHRADGPDRFLITMTLPEDADDAWVDTFLNTLSLD